VSALNLTTTLYFLWCLAAAGAAGEEVRIGVFGLFRPSILTVAPHRGATLKVTSGAGTFTISGASRHELRGPAQVTGVDGGAADFVLAVPGRIERQYRGVLSVKADGDVLVAVVTMDRETAVASVIAAESPPGAGIQALKAQAVAARSFYAAAGDRHRGLAFCDTTHCQFLREPPAAATVFEKAGRETAGLLLRYRGAPVEALYSASCGGRTKTLAEAGLSPGPYPYVAVDCPCHGASRGHGVGLCQEGAARLAARGLFFREILRHYFPGAVVE
jgi:peptidoglycan hydrolase-like amidase